MKKFDEHPMVNKAMLEQQIAELKTETAFNRSDVEFFKTLMAMIKLNRDRLQILSDTLNSIE